MIITSKKKKTATIKFEILAKQDKKYYKNKKIVLADKQIQHINKWKTWSIKNK